MKMLSCTWKNKKQKNKNGDLTSERRAGSFRVEVTEFLLELEQARGDAVPFFTCFSNGSLEQPGLSENRNKNLLNLLVLEYIPSKSQTCLDQT